MFRGGNPMAFEETAEWCVKWSALIQMFCQSVDRRTGSFLHLPFSGGVLEQPSKTMTIFRVLQEEFSKVLTESLKR